MVNTSKEGRLFLLSASEGDGCCCLSSTKGPHGAGFEPLSVTLSERSPGSLRDPSPRSFLAQRPFLTACPPCVCRLSRTSAPSGMEPPHDQATSAPPFTPAAGAGGSRRRRPEEIESEPQAAAMERAQMRRLRDGKQARYLFSIRDAHKQV